VIAVGYERAGDASVLEVRELERPDPGPGEVRVRLAVSGVNPSDWKSRLRATYGGPATFTIPHQDGAGTIDAVGDGVDAARMGERVWVFFAAWKRPWGTAAQWTVVPQERAVALPERASFELGASLGIPALTAYRCLFSDGPLAGATVLVAGGAGAVGHAAIQLARHAGARVVATVSGPEKEEVARRAGANAVVNYRDTDATVQIRAAAPDGVDRVVELALDANGALDLAVLAPDGVISTYATEGAPHAELPVRALIDLNARLRFVMIYSTRGLALREAVEGVAKAVEARALATPPVHRFPLAETARAQDAVESGAVGKVLVEIP
jgi:NADPH2:quinone reductase